MLLVYLKTHSPICQIYQNDVIKKKDFSMTYGDSEKY